jgi:NSS family neurotransmitter:Na+ symporter
VLDYLTSGWMLPLGALCMALFTAWIMKPEHTAEELGARKGVLRIWLWLMRYLVPVIILVIFLQAVGVIAL